MQFNRSSPTFQRNVSFLSSVISTGKQSVQGTVYEQTGCMAVGSPLFPVIANFYIYDFGETVLYQAAHKPPVLVLLCQ
jgi:hypothetical protein